MEVPPEEDDKFEVNKEGLSAKAAKPTDTIIKVDGQKVK